MPLNNHLFDFFNGITIIITWTARSVPLRIFIFNTSIDSASHSPDYTKAALEPVFMTHVIHLAPKIIAE
ncbi:hypothetical protein BofuT4_uP160120.1 [Botrytis cinerea T4]|uniref:Uncharacterized protein n=1 Tax=Botryotinia fuckeliana (strain T4) TaxID=999810 RepID=G2YU93_BOTF4|nr:hypothetical protein BofuT4_uP160120.1 [Botrytis cinerea T4]